MQVITKLPEEVQHQATVKAISELPGELDPATKLEIIRKEQQHIDAQRVAEKDVKKAAEVASLEVLTDKADVLEPHFSEQRKSPSIFISIFSSNSRYYMLLW